DFLISATTGVVRSLCLTPGLLVCLFLPLLACTDVDTSLPFACSRAKTYALRLERSPPSINERLADHHLIVIGIYVRSKFRGGKALSDLSVLLTAAPPTQTDPDHVQLPMPMGTEPLEIARGPRLAKQSASQRVLDTPLCKSKGPGDVNGIAFLQPPGSLETQADRALRQAKAHAEPSYNWLVNSSEACATNAQEFNKKNPATRYQWSAARAVAKSTVEFIVNVSVKALKSIPILGTAVGFLKNAFDFIWPTSSPPNNPCEDAERNDWGKCVWQQIKPFVAHYVDAKLEQTFHEFWKAEIQSMQNILFDVDNSRRFPNGTLNSSQKVVDAMHAEMNFAHMLMLDRIPQFTTPSKTHWLEAIPDWLNMTMIMQDTEVHFPEEKMPAASLDYFNCTGFNLTFCVRLQPQGLAIRRQSPSPSTLRPAKEELFFFLFGTFSAPLSATSSEERGGNGVEAKDLHVARTEASWSRSETPWKVSAAAQEPLRRRESSGERSRPSKNAPGPGPGGATGERRRGSLQERAAALERLNQAAPQSRQRPKALRNVPRTTASLCRAASEANAAFRAHMEDSSVIIDPLLAEQDGELWGYFAVYDGHGGRQAVDFCETKLHGLVLDELLNVTRMAGEPVADEVVGEVLSRAFRRVDEQLKLLGTWRCGCTATVVLAHRTASGLRLHSANVGDSRAIVLESGSECRLTRDHRPTDPAEIQRVEAEGGFVARGRVVGQLGVSRALGDHSLKSVGVTWHPHICTREVPQ
ncbi:PTC1, partial [Symbiodinium sp. KB8]